MERQRVCFRGRPGFCEFRDRLSEQLEPGTRARAHENAGNPTILVALDSRLQARRIDLVPDEKARREVLSISLVGYTNAGKSTLFNALARAKAYEADQLFATLDTTTRRVWIPEAGDVVVSDTVGFIRDLPHGLVAAFRATLEETVHADLLLHVVDASSAVRDEQAAAVDKVLAEIPAGEAPRLLVWNKIDAAGLEPGVERDQYGRISRVFVSARTGAGLELLRQAIAEFAKARAATKPEAQPVHTH